MAAVDGELVAPELEGAGEGTGVGTEVTVGHEDSDFGGRKFQQIFMFLEFPS